MNPWPVAIFSYISADMGRPVAHVVTVGGPGRWPPARTIDGNSEVTGSLGTPGPPGRRSERDDPVGLQRPVGELVHRGPERPVDQLVLGQRACIEARAATAHLAGAAGEAADHAVEVVV